MKSFEELNAIVDTVRRLNLPRDYVLIMNEAEKKETDDWLKWLSGTGLQFGPMAIESPHVNTISFRGHTFHIASTGYIPFSIEKAP